MVAYVLHGTSGDQVLRSLGLGIRRSKDYLYYFFRIELAPIARFSPNALCSSLFDAGFSTIEFLDRVELMGWGNSSPSISCRIRAPKDSTFLTTYGPYQFGVNFPLALSWHARILLSTKSFSLNTRGLTFLL